MSGYRAVVGYGVLKRGNKEAIAELPYSSSDKKARLRPDELISSPSTYLEGGTKWNRFGAGVDAEITIERNINFHNDIGKRTYTVATTGIAEPSITINGYVSAEYLDWMRFALNVDESTQVISFTPKYKYGEDYILSWDADVTYDFGDIIEYGDSAYIALNITNNKKKIPNENTTYWKVVSDFAEYTGWDASKTYTLFNTVTYNGKYYVCIKAVSTTETHTSPDKSTTEWKELEKINANTTDTFSYEHPNGVRTFDIMYVQMNSKTNDYAGYDEYHILTGCAVSTVTFSYELGSDAGVKFSIEILALMDWYSLVDENSTDINTYLEDIPADVFSTGCISKSTDGSTYEAVAQTDSASLTISNFVERRGNCNTNYGSGYSMGTLNVEMDTSTYSNDPKKYMMAMYGYSDAATENTYGMKKTPYQIPYIRFHTENGDSIDGTTKTKEIDIVINKVIPTSLNKSYSSESAILDSPKLRGENIIFTVKYPPITSETVIKTPTGKKSTTGSS
jgi:hypothetical protein